MSETRVHKMKDGSEIIQREWESDSGLVIWCPEKSCVFCKKCEDVVYDHNGPYMFACKNIEHTEAGYKGECPEFELDEEEMKKQDDNPEIAKAFRETLFNALMFGDRKDEMTDD